MKIILKIVGNFIIKERLQFSIISIFSFFI